MTHPNVEFISPYAYDKKGWWSWGIMDKRLELWGHTHQECS
jgi:hypothetical protein